MKAVTRTPTGLLFVADDGSSIEVKVFDRVAALKTYKYLDVRAVTLSWINNMSFDRWIVEELFLNNFISYDRAKSILGKDF